jgi:hypothetical protein
VQNLAEHLIENLPHDLPNEIGDELPATINVNTEEDSFLEFIKEKPQIGHSPQFKDLKAGKSAKPFKLNSISSKQSDENSFDLTPRSQKELRADLEASAKVASFT